ncbi:MAG: IS66 family insertion sequence element accessory protein TnpA [Burkholderiales bacterium]
MRTQKKLTGGERECLVHVRRARARKLSLAQYCRAEGLSVQSLYNLRHQLSAKSGRGQGAAAARKPKPRSRFIAVQVAPAPEVAAAAACRLHLKGWVIECASLPPTVWLAGLMAGDLNAVS